MANRKKVHSKVKTRKSKAAEDSRSAEEKYLDRVERLREERRKRYEKQGLSTVGVRFAHSPGKEYTYLVRQNTLDINLGVEVVVKTDEGFSRCAYVTRLDGCVLLPEDYDEELKQIRKVVVDL